MFWGTTSWSNLPTIVVFVFYIIMIIMITVMIVGMITFIMIIRITVMIIGMITKYHDDQPARGPQPILNSHT